MKLNFLCCILPKYFRRRVEADFYSVQQYDFEKPNKGLRRLAYQEMCKGNNEFLYYSVADNTLRIIVDQTVPKKYGEVNPTLVGDLQIVKASDFEGHSVVNADIFRANMSQTGHSCNESYHFSKVYFDSYVDKKEIVKKFLDQVKDQVTALTQKRDANNLRIRELTDENSLEHSEEIASLQNEVKDIDITLRGIYFVRPLKLELVS